MEKKIKILIWGMGRSYNRYLNILKYWEKMQEIEIAGVTDKDIPDVSKVDDWKLYKTKDVHELDIDFVLVMSEKYYLEIASDILALGIDKKKILSCKILEIPYFSWNNYIKIQQSDLSIICNNCVGGIIYNTLGLECKSPCKNLAIPDRSFLEIIQDLERYMECEPEFVRWQIDRHSGKRFPVMSLDGMEICCNHDTSIEEAKEKWNRRKKKINYENIILIMYTENDETGRRFLSEAKYKKVLFVPESSRIEDKHEVFKLKLLPGQKEFYEVVNSSATLGRNSYNYSILDMLIGKKEWRYR